MYWCSDAGLCLSSCHQAVTLALHASSHITIACQLLLAASVQERKGAYLLL